ncbi:hypothetical protein QBC33DRAFT_28792 [Phialemonium atrogriseum]|uniref:Uncharacterized protein n=1 Tax=Phialemonium atrogriseum TaxID=1093897 RepID=A0AAJ0CA30_9PEZI|nr:uncharacterized protein QBC33DRAFT_28792 [Phialemonium atrogriseum]KAK1772750.1 hypothetical protein QBC33DRAFT_28792 [Phialemonium atrogriseum]
MAPFPQDPSLPGYISLSTEKLQSLAQDLNLQPTQTLKQVAAALQRRQSAPATTVTVVSDSGGGGGKGSSLSGGAIAGIVIGSIAGFLLLWWIVYSCTNMGAPPRGEPAAQQAAWYDGVRDEYPPRSPGRRSSRSRSHRRRSTEVRHSRPVAVVAGGSPRAPTYVYERDGRDARSGRSREHRSRSRY